MKNLLVGLLAVTSLSTLANDLTRPSKKCIKNILKAAETLEKLNAPNEPLRSYIGYGGKNYSDITTTIIPTFSKNNGETIQYNFEGRFDEENCQVETVKRIVNK